MTLEVSRMFCETCKAGPFMEGAKGSGGMDIIKFHTDQGHRVVVFDSIKHEKHDPLGDSIDAMISALNNTAQKRKDERELRIEKYGKPMKQIEDYLTTQIKDDPLITKQLIRVYLSAYTNNPINMAILAPSSDGKTYSTIQVSKLFPQDDFIIVGRMSPTALIHAYGVPVDSEGKPIAKKIIRLQKEMEQTSDKSRIVEIKQELREIFATAKTLVDLTNKVLLFLDNPNEQTYEVLKPILSHDKEEILYKTTKGNGSLEVKETIIKGWPATIVCSAKNEAKNEVWPEIETRFFMTSPNGNISKYKKANAHTAKKMSLPKWSSDIYDNSEDKKWCTFYISEIIEELKQGKETWSPLYDLIAKKFPSNEGVTMRHISRLFAFCNVETLINADERPYLSFKTKEDEVIKTWIGTMNDLEQAFDIMGRISTIAPDKLRFYENIFVPQYEENNKSQALLSEQEGKIATKQGVLNEQLVEKFQSTYKKNITSKQVLERYLYHLVNEGMIYSEDDDDKGFKHRYFPTNELTIHRLDELKSMIVDEVKNEQHEQIKKHLISCLKDLLTCSSRFRKTPLFFIQDKQVINFAKLFSEITRTATTPET